MKPTSDIERRIDDVGAELAQALGARVACIAVYGSAASDEFSPAHSDVNLLIVLHAVEFADLRLIGATLARVAQPDLRLATPLVVTPAFLRDARDSFPIELDDIRDRHRVLAGDDLPSTIRVLDARIREQAEREARGKLLLLRALVIHRPPDEELRQALASLVAVLAIVERALLAPVLDTRPRGDALLAAVAQHAGVKLRALPRLATMRDGGAAWPAGADLDELLALVLREVEALVHFVDGHGG
jgi:hypothetical protein